MRALPNYLTGELIQEGDVVRIGQLEGVVESVITKSDATWADGVGEGVMLAGPAFGRLFTGFEDEDLTFVRRGHP